ncbi:DUF2306 domain-containing protein [uncultured Aquimarina sp.]|uniref:DUF2306 domain-containing protein n=1 Tax=uncultured Aquimarina sp. TaxID=575652 RepID=UPI0026077DD3|nr:DUF2306 domain-containing protein [uncultured Aquimarina sp.]
MKKGIRILFVLCCILIGLYPFSYFILHREFGLLSTKDPKLLLDLAWNISFYFHIILGGIALLTGWTQFSEKIRVSKIKLHRFCGRVYVISALFSGLAGIYIGFFATGGIIASLGFISLGVLWILFTFIGFSHIRQGLMDTHKKYMYYSFACCFAAVTLRIWLPLLTLSFGDFIVAYKIVAWLCWVPNLVISHFLIRNNDLRNSTIRKSIHL